MVHPVQRWVSSAADPDKWPICELAHESFGIDREDEARGNAALIAAAPELLDALELVASCMLRGGDGQVGDFGWRISALTAARPKIHAAIATARGQ